MIHQKDTETRIQKTFSMSSEMKSWLTYADAFWLVVILSMVIFIGCDEAGKAVVSTTNKKAIERNAKVEQVLQSALATSTDVEVQAWREFLNTWPSGQQKTGFTWDADLKKFQGVASAATLVEDRYVFKIILDFEIGSDFQKVTVTKLRFHFSEIKKVVLPPEGASGGGVSISFQPDQKWFGLEDWKRLVEAHWNFHAIGITIVSNALIQNIRSLPLSNL